MFTGLVEAVGTLLETRAVKDDLRLKIVAQHLPWDDIDLGASISVNGVCLTVVEFIEGGFAADASKETMSCTSLQFLKAGTQVNLERALTLNKPLGGHLVSGHVDGLVRLVSATPDARSIRYVFEVPKELMHYIAGKGSVCLDGISLTVNTVDGQLFDVNLIPHTQEVTNAHHWHPGQLLNIEVDLIARYLERFTQVGTLAGRTEGVSMQTLIDNGFISK